jgi:SAM-dependent methyltransferase
MTVASSLDATRAAYDTIAASYAELVPAIDSASMESSPLDAFVWHISADGGGPVADIGCGTGRVTAYLDAAGLDVFGIDLSPGMVKVARACHPGLRFSKGSMLALDVPDAALAGVVSWYSIIHLPPEWLPEAFAEFFRILRPGGWLVIAFYVGDRHRHMTQAYGHHGISLDVYWLPVQRLRALLVDAGFAVDSETLIRPGGKAPQARLMAKRPAS